MTPSLYKNVSNLITTKMKFVTHRCAKLIETGLRARLIIRHSGRKPMCMAEVLSADSVDFFEIAHTLAFLILGALLSVAMMLIETIVHLHSTSCGNLGEARRFSDYA